MLMLLLLLLLLLLLHDICSAYIFYFMGGFAKK